MCKSGHLSEVSSSITEPCVLPCFWRGLSHSDFPSFSPDFHLDNGLVPQKMIDPSEGESALFVFFFFSPRFPGSVGPFSNTVNDPFFYLLPSQSTKFFSDPWISPFHRRRLKWLKFPSSSLFFSDLPPWNRRRGPSPSRLWKILAALKLP